MGCWLQVVKINSTSTSTLYGLWCLGAYYILEQTGFIINMFYTSTFLGQSTNWWSTLK
jgi:hypothetical protein